MATAEEGGATTNAASSYGGGGGGAGGKFRKKPFRKTTTPYDRPAIALRGNGSSSSSSWLSKLVVDPASKLISYGARRFFESVFRKRRLPPPPPQTSESNHVLRDGLPDAVLSEPAGGECSNTVSSCANGISDLEQLLEQKTFTRSEIDHLTKLLHSRAGEVSVRDDGTRNEETVSDSRGHQEIESDPMEANIYEDRSHGVDTKVLGDSITSHFQLAKAYVGSGTSKLSPSVLGNQRQVTREDTNLFSNTKVASKPVSMSLTTKATVGSGSPENGYMANPRSVGRSAIYNMARTPYLKRTGINRNGSAGLSVPSTSLTILENCEKSEPKPMTLKRRNFVLDDEVGSFGSIRRTRLKPNLIAPGFRHTDDVGSKSDAIPAYSKQKLHLNGDSKHVQENTDVSIPSTSYALVPLKTNGGEVAVRRSGNLNRGSNMVDVRQKSTFQLTPSMLRGQALRSMDDASSSELLRNGQDDHNFENSAGFMDADDSTPQDQGKVEENVPLETSSPSNTYDPVKLCNPAVSFEASLVRGQTSDDVENGFSEPQNKAAFRMSAMEDYIDLDDDELASHPSSDGRGPLEAHLAQSKFSPLEEPKFLETTIQQELNSHSDLISSKTNEASTAGTSASSLGERNNCIITPASEEVTAAARPSITPSVAAFDKHKEINNPPPLFSFSTNVADKSSSLMLESSSRTPEISSSLLNVFASTGSPVEMDNNLYLKPLAAEDANGKSDTAASHGLVSGAPAESFTATTYNNTQQISTSAPVIFTPSVSVSDSAPPGTGSSSSAPSSRITFGASETPKLSGESAFKFCASPDPSTKLSAASTTITPAGDLKNEAVTDPSSGRSSSSPTDFVAFGIPSSGNMTSGLSSSTSNPSADNAQGSLFSSASKSFLPAVGTVSQGLFTQSNSFAPPPSSNTDSSTSFVSSLPGAQVPSAVVPFGFNSSASSSDTGLVASSSGSTSSLFGLNPPAVANGSAGSSNSFTTPSLFSFGLSSSSSSINAVGSTTPFLSSSGSASVTTSSFGSVPSSTNAVGSTAAPVFNFGAVGSTGGAAAPVFGFGASFSGSASAITSSFSSSASTTSAVGSTSGAAPSGFSFGLSNPASASASNAASSFSNGAFSFGGSSSASSSAINSVKTNNAPSNPFGSSLQAPNPFGSSPATGFSFGAAATSSVPISSAPVVFNSSTAPSSSSPFLFSSAPSVFSSPAPSLSQPVFGNPANGFGASSPGNNYQMNGEDSMAEDPVQSTSPSVPVFGQANNISPSPSGFMFGSTTVPSQANPFQFGGQQSQPVPQNPSVFQASGSVEFNAGGSFSLGSGGGDKSGRKFVKANRNKNRKK